MSRDRCRLTVSPSVLTCADVVIEYLLQCLRSQMARHVTSQRRISSVANGHPLRDGAVATSSWVARSDRAPWKAICWRFGIARATAIGGGSMGSAQLRGGSMGG